MYIRTKLDEDISQRAAELLRFMCLQNGGRPPSWIFAETKFEGAVNFSIIINEE